MSDGYAFFAEAVKQIRSWRRVGEIPEEFTFLPIDFGFYPHNHGIMLSREMVILSLKDSTLKVLWGSLIDTRENPI